MVKDSAETGRKERAGAKPRNRLFVESLAKGLRLLESFAQAPHPLSLSEIAARAGADRSAAQRLTHTLLELGYLERVPAGVRLGPRNLERAFDYLRASELVNRAVPIMADLRREVKERVDLSLFDGDTLLYLVRMQSKRDTSHSHLIGRRIPTFCTAGGRAILSRMSMNEALGVLSRCDMKPINARTITDIAQILGEIEKARVAGFSVSLEETLIGEISAASAILDAAGQPVAALHICASLGDWRQEDYAERMGPLVAAAADALSGAYGASG
ncbi:MAG: IclR family transcriptional regulator [Pikeienuella sp.]